MSRNWHAEHVPGGIAIGESSYHTRRVVMINPTQKSWCDGRSFVLWFGTCSPTYLHVYTGNRFHAPSLEDALEECAAWLAEHAPGHLMPFGGDEHTELVREACEDHGVAFEPEKFCGVIDSEHDRVLQDAEADLTYTESGFLTSYEWGIALENPSTADLYAFISGE